MFKPFLANKSRVFFSILMDFQVCQWRLFITSSSEDFLRNWGRRKRRKALGMCWLPGCSIGCNIKETLCKIQRYVLLMMIFSFTEQAEIGRKCCCKRSLQVDLHSILILAARSNLHYVKKIIPMKIFVAPLINNSRHRSTFCFCGVNSLPVGSKSRLRSNLARSSFYANKS